MIRPGKITMVEKARAAWGENTPAEVIALADYADRRTGVAAAKALGLSPSLVSHVIANGYTGDVPTVFARIRGAMMGEAVQCPVLGEIGRDSCIAEQRKPFSASSAARARVYRACRSGCPHSDFKEA